MAEETVWTGCASQYKNIGAYALCAVIAVALFVIWYLFKLPAIVLVLEILPIFYAFAKWLRIKSHSYRLTTERLLTTQGVFSKVTETLELYRVKDLRTKQSFLERLAGLESVELLSSDVDTPDLVMECIPADLKLQDKIRDQVESCRVKKGTRELDLE